MRRRASQVRASPFDRKSQPKSTSNDKSMPNSYFDSTNLNKEFVNRSDIKKQAIQVFYTEGINTCSNDLPSNIFTVGVLHPNGSIRRCFDFITVIWVLFLVFIIPFMIGFDWYVESKGQKIFLNLLDVWFAIDIILNFRTGYINHGTIIMTPKKIVW